MKSRMIPIPGKRAGELEDLSRFKDEFDQCFEALKHKVDQSFAMMENSPQSREDILQFWKERITQFISYTYQSSERHNNKEVFKAITKALIFGK